MTPYYADDWLTVYHGDSRAVMAELPAESVHCVVTSPPYWGLRDYGTATWVGGDDACDHRQGRPGAGRADGIVDDRAQRNRDGAGSMGGDCRKCGATRLDSQLGLEPTPEAYVANLVEVFREVRRVLRSDGTVWLNLGDSYAGSWGAQSRTEPVRNGESASFAGGQRSGGDGLSANQIAAAPKRTHTGSWVGGRGDLKPKDLVGIPWRVAFALQADGWYLRSDIIWSKPNPMPESVTDRPTKSHEYLFLLTKSARYYFDADAVREADSGAGGGGWSRTYAAAQPAHGAIHDARPVEAGRNIRSVWTIATAPYPGAHFATFPPKLVEPCIKAGTSERGVCPECGAPWERIVERGELIGVDRGGNYEGRDIDRLVKRNPGTPGMAYENKTTGWRPSCAHDATSVPATILDPFAGSGTTGMVAQSLSRRAVLIDLSMDYLAQLMDRNRDIPLGLGA